MTIRHELDCTSRDDSTVYLTTGSRGDAMRRCRDCGRFELGAEPRPSIRPRPQPAAVAVVAVVEEPEPVPVPVVVPAARWVCRDHGNAVSWRGRGCARCTEFLAMTAAERRRARQGADR